MKLKSLFQMAFSLFFCFALQAQNKLIGKIMDQKQQPISDAQVFVNDKNANVSINQRGYFEIEIPKGVNEIKIYSPKHGILASDYNGEENLSFMFLDNSQEDAHKDKVSIGYGEVNRDDLTYAVEKIDTEVDDQAKGYNNIYDFIRGRLAGVRVTNNNQIIIRGVNTINLSTDPLFVVDGSIVNNIDYINVQEVKDISVLKDAAASIYGSRGANGVIQITLKR